MANQSSLQRAAETVLTNCLSLPEGAKVTILMCEETIEPAMALAEAAVHLRLQPVPLFISREMHLSLAEEPLSPAIESLVTGATAVLNCLCACPACLPLRERVRTTAWDAGCQVAHMPGVTTDTLRLADVDYAQIQRQCRMLALALAKSRRVEIVTIDSDGCEHVLSATLDPWVRLPIISDGVIQPGSWGNIPPGETYVAPLEDSAEGSIVIDGSQPGYVFDEDELILHFQHGRLQSWAPVDSPAADHFVAQQVEHARREGDSNWRNLAEIGIGVNPKVGQLSGSPLLDEKKLGTIHIALGDSTDMGGLVTSAIHCDMVTRTPRVLLDGKTIVADGSLVLDVAQWREDYRNLVVEQAWEPDTVVEATVTRCEVDAERTLWRMWDTSAGRVCSVPVGSRATAPTIARVHNTLVQLGQPLTVGALADHIPQLPLVEVLQITQLLRRYGLLRVGTLEEQG